MTEIPIANSATIRWQVGVVCRDGDSSHHCLESLVRAGWEDAIRLFVGPGAMVPKDYGHLPVTCLDSDLGEDAWGLLILAEMLMRAPEAEAHLLIRGDVAARHSNLRSELESLLEEDTIPGIVLLDRGEIGTEQWNRQGKPSLRHLNAAVITTTAARDYLADRSVVESACRQPPSADLAGAFQAWAFGKGVPVYAPDRNFVCAAQDTSADTASASERRIRVYGKSLSIVVPSWNCGPYLRPCLRSLLDQTVEAEVIVVDDASDDETARILLEFSDRIQVHRHEQRHGANAARNTGLRRAVGDFVVMADADNAYSPRWLEKLLDALLTDPNAGLAYCGFSRQTEDGQTRRFGSGAWDPRRLWYNNYIDMPSLVRREALPDGGLVEGFRPFDDWRLWLDMASRGWTGRFVAEDLYVKRVRKDSKTLRSKSLPADRARDVAGLRRRFAQLVGLDNPVAVVIPASGCEDLTVKCIAHVADFSGVPFVVHYVDNGSPISVLDTVSRAAEQCSAPLRIIRNSSNLGFTAAVNQGIEASGDANVLVLNNDCFVGPNCIENLSYEMATRNRVAAAGPVTCDRGGQSLRSYRHRLEAGVNGSILDHLDDPVETASKLLQRHKTVEREVLAFFCTLLNREAIRRHGGLDDRFSSGLAADDEWCHRVRGNGWRTLLAYGAYAAHLHKSTFKRLDIDRDSLQEESKQLLREVLDEAPMDKS